MVRKLAVFVAIILIGAGLYFKFALKYPMDEPKITDILKIPTSSFKDCFYKTGDINPETYDCIYTVDEQYVPTSDLEIINIKTAEPAIIAEGEKKENLVITTKEGFDALYNSIYAEIEEGFRPQYPDINFETQNVIVLFAGNSPSSGYTIKPLAVFNNENEIDIVYINISPGPNCIQATVITKPYSMFAIEKIEKPVKFTEVPIITSCPQE